MSDTSKTFDIAESTLYMRGIMTSYLSTSKMTPKDYAKLVGVPLYKISAVCKGIVAFDDLTIGELRKICQFHKLEITIR